MRLVVLALVLTLPAAAQASFASGPGPFLNIQELDVSSGDGDTGSDFALGWRFAGGTDLGVAVDAQRIPGLASHFEVRGQVGRTWEMAPRTGATLAASAGYGWRSTQTRGGRTVPLDGGVVEASATAFYRLSLGGSVAVRPTLGVFAEGHGAADPLLRASSSGSLLYHEIRDVAGAVIVLPVTFRIAGADLAVSPSVRLGMGIEDHAFWSDGGMRLHINL